MSYDYRKMLAARKKADFNFTDVSSFMDMVAAYFEWCEDHPLLEEQVNVFRGEVTRYEVSKPRAFTKKGLCSFLGVTVRRYDELAEKGEEWRDGLNVVDDIIYTQKFEHAAVSLMNSNIIARDLGLADRQEVDSKVDAKVSAGIDTSKLSDAALAELIGVLGNE